ncbi:hypothetical protein [Nocardioides insulae]|uniref:hypothetical protein n=1 Tax=Nocardioides insulae TaxID=394734 RepID=UPI000412F6F4|nr:hypothetical protein [Nocardioides insulae]
MEKSAVRPTTQQRLARSAVLVVLAAVAALFIWTGIYGLVQGPEQSLGRPLDCGNPEGVFPSLQLGFLTIGTVSLAMLALPAFGRPHRRAGLLVTAGVASLVSVVSAVVIVIWPLVGSTDIAARPCGITLGYWGPLLPILPLAVIATALLFETLRGPLVHDDD